jgi:Type III restriction enzyme, res subunit
VQVQVVRGNLLYIEKKGLPSAMLNRLLRLGAFQNPEFYKAQAMRLPTFNKPRVIACGEELADHIALPRGCLAEVIELLKSHRIKPMVRDERSVGRPIEVEFSGRLRPLQQDAVDAFAQHDEGILCAPTAFGKTAVAAWLIASRKVNTLILVHRQQLLTSGMQDWRCFSVFPQSQSAKSGRGGQTQPLCGYCHSSKRPRQGTGERLRGRVWPSDC